jgi:hypothetical protein
MPMMPIASTAPDHKSVKRDLVYTQKRPTDTGIPDHRNWRVVHASPSFAQSLETRVMMSTGSVKHKCQKRPSMYAKETY